MIEFGLLEERRAGVGAPNGQRRKGRKALIIGLIVAGVLCTSCLGCLVFAYFGGKRMQEELQAARDDCQPPGVFRPKDGEEEDSLDLDDWECVGPDVIEAKERARREQQEREDAERRAEREREEAVEEARRREARAAAQQIVDEVAGSGDRVRTLEEAVRRRRWAEAREILDDVMPKITRLREAEVELPENVAALAQRIEEQAEAVTSFEAEAFESVFAATSPESGTTGNYDRALAEGAQQAGISAEYAQTILDRNDDEVTRRLDARAAAADRAAQAERQERERRCGPRPLVSPWDGTVVAAEDYVEQNANDPDSIEFASCTPPTLTEDCWVTTCRFRGANAFGATVLNTARFTIGRHPVLERHGRVLQMQRL